MTHGSPSSLPRAFSFGSRSYWWVPRPRHWHTDRSERRQASGKSSACPQLRLLEFDHRFDLFTEFVPYDYQHPLRLPRKIPADTSNEFC